MNFFANFSNIRLPERPVSNTQAVTQACTHACARAHTHTHTHTHKAKVDGWSVVVKGLKTSGVIEMYFDTDIKTLT